ncbi:chemotaxis protein CheB [Steroidobacter sp.]|uniref:chemotaxis protein CheB n=1 Tax=Steroidobacter sp. TaxID=1978227 RepID=UPI001A571458|nr:chemotaxis protein CheB [Steroidobacter sp.]MBL8268005.1 PAS domain S-box protein [Steroidobacter sp.]
MKGRRTKPKPPTARKKAAAPRSASHGKNPAKANGPLPLSPLVVGIGASAGGLEAFTTFFTHMPADSGMVFVLVQHLDPHHKSMLVDLLGRHTAMPVVEASNGVQLGANRIFIIPPNATLTLRGGMLRVSRPAPAREHRRPIDTFFASLAEDQGERAVCVVLSGTGSDGSLGLRKIKEHGGLSLAQADADATAMSGMPQSAAATGLVDHIVPVAQMPALLVDYQQHLHEMAPRKDGDGNRVDMPEHMTAICSLLRAGAGHDFSQYKRNTLLRRIQRRMQVLRIDAVPAFVERLRKEPRQVELLFRELLIGVTQFFRDPLAFAALERTVLPKLLEHKHADDPLRIWVPACATGEEVYSIAILVKEALERAGLRLKVQIFGTDVDDAAVTVARAARYHKRMEGVPRERIERWFVADGEEYCPAREIREMCIFSTHSVIKDPPFSRLDLISCRNLLIYLEPSLQDRLMQIFHYALRSDGYLILGQSEGITRKTKLFATVDKKHRIFQRRQTAATASDFLLTSPPMAKGGLAARLASRAPDPVDAEIRSVMDKYSPAYVVVDRHHDIVRFSGGELGRFLEPSPGTASLNLLGMVQRALRPAVRAAMQQAHKTAQTVISEHPILEIGGKSRSIKLIVAPLADEPGTDIKRWVVAFQEAALTASKPARAGSDMSHLDLQALEQELLTTKTQLRATIDELETSNEEMKSANEEYQSINEELQSSNEELETAKEEMQSINEELQTINAEMSSKNETLTRLNSDLKNLLDSTQIATLFLDNKLRIAYFTPAMTQLFHLRDSDRGRPITDLVTRIHYDELRRDVTKVLHSLAVLEHEVSIVEDGTVFLMRMRPYRTVDDVIDGVVITFLDITARKRHEQNSAHLAAIVESSQDAIISHTFDSTITSWNAGAEAIFGYSAAEAIGRPFSMLIPSQQSEDVPQILDRVKHGERVEHFEIDRLRKDGKQIDVSLTHSPIKDASGQIVAASTIAREFTERKLAEDHRKVLVAELDHRIKNTLAVISALIAQTVKSADSPADFARIVQGRIQALSRVHDLLNVHQQSHAELRDVVSGELAAYRLGKEDRIRTAGRERVCLTAKAAQTLSMALHELCTNAAKYGALSTISGQVDVSWSVTNAAPNDRLSLQWIETGGPPVVPPTRRGFGSELIERIVRNDLEADVQRDFLKHGVRCAIAFALSDKTGYVITATDEAG